MKNNTRNILFLLVPTILLIGAMFTFVDAPPPAEPKPKPVWRTSPSGLVRYYKDCIEGHVFLVTPSTHEYEQLAGPLGKCE